MKVVSIIPVKSTSSRIPNKNIKLLADKPLFIHTLEKLLSITEIDEVWIDTDDIKIINIARNYGCKNFKYFLREKKYATNATDGNKLLKNEIDNIDSDIYLQVLATSPFTKRSSIIQSINILKKGNHKSVIGCFKEKYYLWDNEYKPLYDVNSIPNSNTLKDTIVETMSLYAITKNEFNNTNKRIGSSPYLLELSQEEVIDINYEKDFSFANKIARLNCFDEELKFNSLKIKLNSCIFSDILNDMGYEDCILPNFKLNNNKNKLFGRVRPIQIRELLSGENSNDIYKCLESYNTIMPGNIIFVNNKVDNKAYFGDLNATIAITKKCQGTIINGFTRDITRVNDLNYPVFYKNNTCSDVKNVGTLDFYDKPITINNIEIFVNSLIFADIDGVVVIPKEIEHIVLEKSIKVIENESQISNQILIGKDINEIIKINGLF